MPSSIALGIEGIKAHAFLVVDACHGTYKILEDGEEIQIWTQHVAEHYLTEMKESENEYAK